MSMLLATSLLTACLLPDPALSANGIDPLPAQPAAPTRLAQEGQSEKKHSRPPVPSLQNLKKIRRPTGKPPTTRPGGRMQPLKPTLRPLTGGRSPAIDRGRPASPGSADRRSARPPASAQPRNSRLDKARAEQPASPAHSPGKLQPAQAPTATATAEQGGGMAAKEQDKKCRPLPRHVRVRMNFNEAEVLEIVQWISEQTCKNFIIGDGIRGGKITILSNTPVTADEAYRAFLSALNVNNMTVVRVGRFYKVQMKRDATKDTIPTYIGNDADVPDIDLMVTQLVQLHYIDANTVNGTVKQLVTKDGDSFPYAPTNTLIISDTGSNLHRIMEIIRQLDTPLGQEEIRVIQIQYALATDLAQTLEEIFGEKGGGRVGTAGSSTHQLRPGRGGRSATGQGAGGGAEEEGVSVSKIIPDERTNQLIVVGTERSFSRLQELIDKLDVPIPGEGQIQVVSLENADAEELANTLTSLAQGSGSRPVGKSRMPAGKSAGPAKAAELFQGEVKVTADKPTNSLVIVASQNDFRSLQKVIKKLDIPRRQVFVEAVIMEVNVDSTRDVGLAFHGGSAADIGGDTVPLLFGTQFKVQGQNINSLSVLPQLNMLGFLSGLQGPPLEGNDSILGSISLPSFGVVLQALQTDSNVDVLSTPHILTSDNEEAEIQVGENIPIPAGYGGGGLGSLTGLASMASQAGLTGSQTAGLGSQYGSYGGLGALGMGLGIGAINRQEVGLTLKIKPQINEGDNIRMELEEELSEVKDTSNPLGPTTTKRSAKTVVVVKDQQTVVVGGLMRDKIDIGESKIPILGDIPVIGWFFRSRRHQKTKTNLLLFLTPYVIESQEDFRIIFERKMRERREFMERFYGRGRGYEAFIDFRRKHGPLADIHRHLTEEMSRLENGGPGAGNEVLITPDGSGQVKKPAPGAEKKTPPTGVEKNVEKKTPPPAGAKQPAAGQEKPGDEGAEELKVE